VAARPSRRLLVVRRRAWSTSDRARTWVPDCHCSISLRGNRVRLFAGESGLDRPSRPGFDQVFVRWPMHGDLELDCFGTEVQTRRRRRSHGREAHAVTRYGAFEAGMSQSAYRRPRYWQRGSPPLATQGQNRRTGRTSGSTGARAAEVVDLFWHRRARPVILGVRPLSPDEIPRQSHGME